MRLKLLLILTVAVFAVSGCQTAPSASSPTETYKAFVEASKKKDVAAMKQLFSKGTMKLIEEGAKASGKTADDSIKDLPVVKEPQETRNEKIDGDNATLEVKDAGGTTWDKFFFTKEDGRWKLAMDKYMDEIGKKVDEQMKKLDQEAPKKDDK